MSFSKRKQFWVDAPLQLQMLGYVLVLVTSSLLLVCFSMLRGLEQASSQSRQIFHSLDWVRQTVSGPLLISSALSILVAGLVTLIWSHRFAGPLRVLSAGMGRLRNGNLAVPTKIRATDTHQELVREFAEMQESVRQRLAEDRKRLHSAVGRVEKLAAGLRSDSPDRKALEELAEELQQIGSGFHL